MKGFLGLSYAASLSALGVASCCVLPMGLMLFGLGGSWLAVFAPVASASLAVLVLSTVVLLVSWLLSFRRRSLWNLKWWLGGSTALTAVAWIVMLKAERINDYLITWM